MSIEERLRELQIDLPEVAVAGNYLPSCRTGNLVFISGQLPKVEGKIAFRGHVGKEIDLESARRGARACVANLLAALKQEIGALDRVKKVVRVTGYVSSFPGFQEQHKVIDAASDLLVELFGEPGRHSRVSVGVVELPLGAAVELEMIVEIK
ncbi:MAG: RidA family protein [Deltaproteobacteria bacterium]|nr:RidA family protein [Deltaproteobacteria bacterium]